MRISLNSCSLKRTAGPWRSLIVVTFRLRKVLTDQRGKLHAASELRIHRDVLPCRAHRYVPPINFFSETRCRLLGCTELRQRFVELIGKFHELADGCDRAARAL